MKKIVILISGRGSNMHAIVRACAADNWPARVVAVIADRPTAPGLALAHAAGITTSVVDSREQPSRADFDQALAREIDRHAPDLVLLAGFMRILGDAFVMRYASRLLNIHPSLLPSFTGLHTHQRALDAGVKVHGATVHFVTPALDSGPIILQTVVPVLEHDDARSLGARVLDAEHRAYPQAVRWFVEDRLVLDGGRVLTRPQASQCLIAQELA